MTTRDTRSRTGLVLLALGAVLTALGLVVLGDAFAPVALVAAVGLLAAGTLLYGTATPREETHSTR